MPGETKKGIDMKSRSIRGILAGVVVLAASWLGVAAAGATCLPVASAPPLFVPVIELLRNAVFFSHILSTWLCSASSRDEKHYQD